MKKLFYIMLSSFLILLISVAYSQNMKLKDYFKQSEVEDYKGKVKDNAIYQEDSRFIIHTFEILANNQFVDKGKIYRQFYKNGVYESFYTNSDKGLFKVSYWSDPTALITANINKKEYCVESNINDRLFPMVFRGYAKIIKSGSFEKKYHNVKFIIKKQKSYKENGNEITVFSVSSKPKVIDGTIEALKGMIILNGNLVVDNDLAKRSGFKLIFSHSDLPNMSKINMKFKCEYNEKKKPDGFMELSLEDIISKYTKIDCE